MAKRKKKEIVPGNSSKRRWEEAHKEPENKFGISKGGWWGLLACEAILLVVCFFTGNIVFGIPALALAVFIEHYGKDTLLAEYNEQVAEYRENIGVGKDGMTEEERKQLMDAMRDARIAKRREKRDRKKAEKLGLTYEEYVAAMGDEDDKDDKNEVDDDAAVEVDEAHLLADTSADEKSSEQ